MDGRHVERHVRILRNGVAVAEGPTVRVALDRAEDSEPVRFSGEEEMCMMMGGTVVKGKDRWQAVTAASELPDEEPVL